MSKNNLDQYYTDPNYAKYFLNKIDNCVPLCQFDIQLEPSAGTGSFFSILDCHKRIGLDLDPKFNGVQFADFLQFAPTPDKKIITVGNPPFGKNANLAVKFFNHAAKFSEAIAFILPRSFRKASIVNRLNLNFEKIFDEDVPDYSFMFENKPYDVWCCAQIWIKKPQPREKEKIFSLNDISDYAEKVSKDRADFSIQRVGGRAGKILESDFNHLSPESHYFFKSKNSNTLKYFKQIDFEKIKTNTAGNPSISPNELVQLFLAEVKKDNQVTFGNGLFSIE